MKIKIISDSTCDLPKALAEKYDVALSPLTIIKDGESFKDNVTITPTEIFAHVAAGGSLCSTAAGNVADYQDLFAQYANQYDGILHISLGSGFSSSYQNACLAAEEFDNVKVVDSQNLSTGQALVVVYACKQAENCESLEKLHADVQAYTERVEASFLLNRLDYMVKGGRCSAATALGANLLNLKPCIEVKNGKMGVVKKYRGNYAKCLSNCSLPILLCPTIAARLFLTESISMVILKKWSKVPPAVLFPAIADPKRSVFCLSENNDPYRKSK